MVEFPERRPSVQNRSRRVGVVTAAVLASLALLAPAVASDWPGWRGPGRDGVSPETGLLPQWGPGGPPLAWKASGIGAGFSSVAVADDRVYTMGDRDGAQHVFALRRDGGGILWKTQVGAPLVDQRGGSRGTPVVDGERVYALGSDGDLVCLDAATGRKVWSRHLSRDYGGQMMSRWMWSESPLVDGDRLVFTPGARDAALVAVDKASGREIWRARIPDLGPSGRDGAGYSSIVVSHGAGVKQYVQLLGRGLVGIRASDGAFLWGYNRVANGVANISTPIVRGDRVFASTGYQTGSVLLELARSGDGVAAREVYFLDAKTLQNHHGGLVLVGDHVYAGHGHNRGHPICVDFGSGEVTWGGDIRNEGTGSAAVLYAEGRLYYRYENGVVLLVEATPTGYREKGSFTIPGVRDPSWAHLAIAGGRLYVREQDTLYCYDLREARAASSFGVASPVVAFLPMQ
jgi:outer membrane protein assembly factor BamB